MKSQKKKGNLKRNSSLLIAITTIALVCIFAGRWIFAIANGYFDSFVQCGSSLSTALDNMEGLSLNASEAEVNLSLGREWDLYVGSRLRDEAYITATDGTILHAGYYDEGGNVTVVVLPRFGMDSTADFLPGSRLAEDRGYNLLLIDYRCHSESGGEYFGYGYFEAGDLACWLDWAVEELGSEEFILWGEGTGANIALWAESEGLLADRVSLIVAESPYASLHELAKVNINKWYTLPAFPFLYAIEAKLSLSDAGYTVKDLELAKSLAASECETPVLFLKSANDEFILGKWTDEIIDAYSGPKDTIFGGGTHGTVYGACRDEIHAYVEAKLSVN